MVTGQCNINKIFEGLMYNRLYNVQVTSSVIYNLQLGYWQKYSTFHAHSLVETLRVEHLLSLKTKSETVDHCNIISKNWLTTQLDL